MLRILKNSVIKGTMSIRPALLPDAASREYEQAGEEVLRLIRSTFGRSLHVREVDTGSCGGCESEIVALSNPLYDVQRFGIDFVASPRHADALLVTGPVSKNMVLALQKTYAAMAEPKFVITLGECARDGGAFKGSYYVEGGVEKALPGAAVLHIPGCPPSPLVIIQALRGFLSRSAPGRA